MFLPGIQLRPLGAILVYSIVGLIAVAFFGSITVGGAVVFIIGGLIVITAVFFLIRRFTGRLSGRR